MFFAEFLSHLVNEIGNLVEIVLVVDAWLALNGLYAFPTWEKEVFELYSNATGELMSIFRQYSKIGGSHAADTMQQTELTNLALDCGIASEAFPMTRVIQIFERADMVDENESMV